MEQPSEQKLKALPNDEDDFWEHSTKEKHILHSVTCTKHTFIRQKQNEAQCTKCPVGYILSPGMNVVDGHIYQGMNFVV